MATNIHDRDSRDGAVFARRLRHLGIVARLATFRRKNRIFGSTQAHRKAESPHRNARWGGFEAVS
jgi:hypothetical protein